MAGYDLKEGKLKKPKGKDEEPKSVKMWLP